MSARLRGTIAVAALAVFAAGTSVAATGDTALLAHRNVARKPTVVKDTKGTPLRLKSKAGDPPLTVSKNTTEVPGLNVAALGGIAATGYGPHTSVFSTAGSNSFEVPAGIHHIVMTVRGGGGGGDGPAGGSSPAGSGGGQGGYAEAVVTVKPRMRFTVRVGRGGAAGINGDAAQDGTDSAVLPVNGTTKDTVVAASGGAGAGAGATCPSTSAGGLGGSPTGPAVSQQPGAIGVIGNDGSAGGDSTCAGGVASAGGSGGPFNFAGSGGQGGSSITSATRGRDGVVTVQFVG